MPLWTLLFLLPLLLFLLDVIGKIATGHSLKTAGADLCMFALSFHISTILIQQMTNALELHPAPDGAMQLYVISLSLVLVSLTLWLLGLVVTGERFDKAIGGQTDPRTRIRGFFVRYTGFILSVMLGGVSIFTVFYMLLLIVRR